MRKLIPCYLQGFQSARPRLQAHLFAATSVADWRAAIADPGQWDFDHTELFPMSALRQARYKGSGQHSRRSSGRVVLPQGWLNEANSDEEFTCLDDYSCEG